MTIQALQNYNRMNAPVFSDLDKIPVFTFFQNLFAQPESVKVIEEDAAVVDIDIQRGNKKIAVYIKRGTSAVNISKNKGLIEKFTSVARVFPLIEEESTITSDMITKRLPGEPVGNPISKMAKQRALAMKAHREHVNRIIRKAEYSAMEAVTLGQQTVDASQVYDFYRRAAHNATASTVWSTSATASPVTDLNTIGNLIFRNGNRKPTDVIMGEGSYEEFLATTEISTTISNQRRIVHLAMDMTIDFPSGYDDWVKSGAVFQGTIKTGNWKFNIWTYPAIYDTDAGTQTQYLSDGIIIGLAKGARFDRYYGPADRLEVDSSIFKSVYGLGNFDADMSANVVQSGIFSSDMFHLDAYGGNNNKAITIRTQHAPIFPTTEIDTVVKMTT